MIVKNWLSRFEQIPAIQARHFLEFSGWYMLCMYCSMYGMWRVLTLRGGSTEMYGRLMQLVAKGLSTLERHCKVAGYLSVLTKVCLYDELRMFLRW